MEEIEAHRQLISHHILKRKTSDKEINCKLNKNYVFIFNDFCLFCLLYHCCVVLRCVQLKTVRPINR